MSKDEWPTEERIDTIGQNGNDGLHYLDVKKQMLASYEASPTDSELLEWFITFINDAGDGWEWSKKTLTDAYKAAKGIN